jgi:ribonuclease J
MDNKFNVEITNNMLFSLGAKVYENSKEDLLHASGHGCQEDLKLMLKLVNPRFFMPFHGEYRMLKNHGKLARDLGMRKENILVCKNGEVVESDGKKFFFSKEKIKVEPNYVFNQRMLDSQELNISNSLRERMSQGGFFMVVIFYDKKNKKISDLPYIFTYGFTNMKKNEALFSK